MIYHDISILKSTVVYLGPLPSEHECLELSFAWGLEYQVAQNWMQG
jgi:hypothetical protein